MKSNLVYILFQTRDLQKNYLVPFFRANKNMAVYTQLVKCTEITISTAFFTFVSLKIQLNELIFQVF